MFIHNTSTLLPCESVPCVVLQIFLSAIIGVMAASACFACLRGHAFACACPCLWPSTHNPEPRPCCHLPCSFNHCAVYDNDNNRLIVFGGRSAERKRLSDVYFLDLDSFTWCVVWCSGVGCDVVRWGGVGFDGVGWGGKCLQRCYSQRCCEVC